MTARRMAWSLAVACIVMAISTLVLLALQVGELTPGDVFVQGGLGGVAFVLAALAFAIVGAFVVSRVPGNAIGWIFCLMGLLVGAGNLAYHHADRALYGSPDSLPAGETAAWLQNLGLPPAFGLLALVLLLFPDGRLPSRRWLPALWVALLGILCSLGYAFRPGPLDWPFESVINPLGIGGSYDLMETATTAGWWLMAAAGGLAGVAMTLRLRQSVGVRRQQLKWIALAAILGGIVILLNTATFFFWPVEGIERERSLVLGLVFAATPLAAGIGILRHRLYDIDVVINRTLVYAGLTATLAGVYVSSVLLLQFVSSGVTGGSSLAVAVSTLAVAALFRPARSWIQEAVDRRFYRRKYDAQRTLEAFAARLRQEVSLDALNAELRGVVAQTVQPAHVSIWMRPR
ncbi:MAG: hypothetical protein M3401_17410 [Actinomycetota bacterium]|nr:hypothetical protein [Actinomycetota bacterium]